jgi:hypothetical protein
VKLEKALELELAARNVNVGRKRAVARDGGFSPMARSFSRLTCEHDVTGIWSLEVEL